ncbi:pyridoxamine 5'-phosphate oxidase family protein [Desulfosporosinus nitroreducens]|uniref:Pyridoxamine 5'-phosphate oxidase family protein n=1 Tax=Desulfosporosinus nitroreducens TaxID=2018668 RepID=A0ABT8QNH4_9FIRM|nr:pyridoxamine 5'-phosphate oxidase family protein [Desulfosporosinus nitroreducens]MDO0822892.1 pyridoxamine 5'-phosphate oxidase family protein [Desulfosporosinus nitroreducens]
MTEKAQRMLNYLAKHNTMILSTYGEEGPWATPVFFVNRGFHIYFLSELTSKHSSNLQDNPLTAAAITEDYQDPKTIQGLQLKGKAYLVKNLKETAVVLASYYKKYPFAMQILQNPSTFKGVSKARWHCIIPQFLKFTDNTIKFGEHIELNLKVDETRDGYELSEVQATLDT